MDYVLLRYTTIQIYPFTESSQHPRGTWPSVKAGKGSEVSVPAEKKSRAPPAVVESVFI
jgi:hypothetical protein